MPQPDLKFSEWDIDIALYQVRHRPSQLIFEFRRRKDGITWVATCINAAPFLQNSVSAAQDVTRILIEASAVFKFSVSKMQGR